MENEAYVYRDRNNAESERLNNQHRIAVRICNGRLLHPRIQTSDIHNVADVATGTGIWLEELTTILGPKAATNHQPRRFDGFDISAAQFPDPGACTGTYKLQNMLLPFPAEYHGIYDLVHVKYMLAALTTEQYSVAAAEVSKLLRPGGYLQWEELDVSQNIAPTPSPSTHERLRELFVGFLQSKRMSSLPSAEVEKAFRDVGLADIVKETRNSYWYDDLDDALTQWTFESSGPIMPPWFLATGKAKTLEEANDQAAEMWKALKEEYKKFGPPNMTHTLVIGRKPI